MIIKRLIINIKKESFKRTKISGESDDIDFINISNFDDISKRE